MHSRIPVSEVTIDTGASSVGIFSFMMTTTEKGLFLLSIDTELAWGGVHNGSFQNRLGHYQRTREAIRQLVALLEVYEIQATWAVTGHLFLNQCRTQGGVKHPEITRPSYQWFAGDWFDVDPCGDLSTDPFWYGPDIVEQILSSNVSQEIGCHGFSHMIVGDPGCSRDCFDSELKACRAEAERWGITLKSFVFPRNSVGHLDVLAHNGFTAFRGQAPDWYAGLRGPVRKLARLWESLLPLPPPVTVPIIGDTICNIPASYFYPHRDGWNRLIPLGLSVQKAKLALDKAVGRRSMFHLWFHPFNLASDPQGLLQGLESIFARVHALRQAGVLTNPTMGDLAASLRSSGYKAPQQTG